MKRKEQKALIRYIRWMANELGLRDWTLRFDWEPCEEDCLAAVFPCEQRKLATIQFSERFLDLAPEQQRNAVIHELLHCHHVGASDMVRLDLLKHLAQSTYDVFWGGFKRQIEYMTDGIATAIEDKYPLIDWTATNG